MPEMHSFEYAVIRFVPVVEREEFINIGVILYCKECQFLDVKTFLDDQRLLSFSKTTNTEQLFFYLASWHLICQAHPHGGPIATLDQAMRFRWLIAYRSTIIQTSRVHPGRCEDPTTELEQLFKFYVL